MCSGFPAMYTAKLKTNDGKEAYRCQKVLYELDRIVV
jgi:hypothetical protein